MAIQAHVARSAGLNLVAVALAHIDNTWVYRGDNDYRGLLTEVDLTEQVFSRGAEVQTWIEQAQAVVEQVVQPAMATSPHCSKPYACGFYEHCSQSEPQAEMPIQWLPRLSAAKWQEQGIHDLRYLAADALNLIQQRVHHCTVHDETYFDLAGAMAELSAHPLPAYFLDFETIQFAVPRWAGLRPYRQVPFQFSLHRFEPDQTLRHDGFLDLSGNDPSRRFAERLIEACGNSGSIYVYNATFENGRMAELAKRFDDLADALAGLQERVVDLLPIARKHYYHPAQQGSWSIKAVLPTLAPDLSYTTLTGVQDGGEAMQAYLEAIVSKTSVLRKIEIEQQLLAYCALDTLAMVRLWEVFTGRQTLGRSCLSN